MRHSREDSLAKDDLALDLIISVGVSERWKLPSNKVVSKQTNEKTNLDGLF